MKRSSSPAGSWATIIRWWRRASTTWAPVSRTRGASTRPPTLTVRRSSSGSGCSAKSTCRPHRRAPTWRSWKPKPVAGETPFRPSNARSTSSRSISVSSIPMSPWRGITSANATDNSASTSWPKRAWRAASRRSPLPSAAGIRSRHRTASSRRYWPSRLRARRRRRNISAMSSR